MRKTASGKFLLLAWVTVGGCSMDAADMTCEPWGTSEEVAARPSPFDSTSITVDSVDLKLCYSRPSARGRVVFGSLVPFDTLWRTGANEATVLHMTAPGTIAGVPVDAGKYSLYTVPRETDWSVVINATTGQWGLTRDERGARGNLFLNAYTQEVRARELGRRLIETEPIPHTETLTASFSRGASSRVVLMIDWEATRVLIPITVNPSRR